MIQANYLTLREVDSVLLENCKRGQRQEAFRIKNKEEKNRKDVIGWGHKVNLVWVRRPRVGLVFGDSLIGYVLFF